MEKNEDVHHAPLIYKYTENDINSIEYIVPDSSNKLNDEIVKLLDEGLGYELELFNNFYADDPKLATQTREYLVYQKELVKKKLTNKPLMQNNKSMAIIPYSSKSNSFKQNTSQLDEKIVEATYFSICFSIIWHLRRK